MTKDWNFAHSAAAEAEWTPGLREIFGYRDVGVKDATNGDYVVRSTGATDTDEVQH